MKSQETLLRRFLRERAHQENQETAPKEVREETEEIEVEVEAREARAFHSDKGAKTFKKHLAKKGLWKKKASRSSCHLLRRKSRKRTGK